MFHRPELPVKIVETSVPKKIPNAAFVGYLKKDFKPSIDAKRIKGNKTWPSFTPQSQHCQEADMQVFVHLSLMKNPASSAFCLWHGDCFIPGEVYKKKGRSAQPFYILDKSESVLLTLPVEAEKIHATLKLYNLATTIAGQYSTKPSYVAVTSLDDYEAVPTKVHSPLAICKLGKKVHLSTVRITLCQDGVVRSVLSHAAHLGFLHVNFLAPHHLQTLVESV